MRLAVWSGPRNLSTALMYSFASRDDFAVWDEPFYAAYLSSTGLNHPMRQEVISGGECNADVVAQRCVGPIPEGKENFYLKVMPHHMLSGFPLEWAKSCTNIHLIRHPARVISSYTAKAEHVSLDDIGYRQQVNLYLALGGLVIDSADIRSDPEGMLRVLCRRIGLSFQPAMLSWPVGGHKDDGPWAPHWYGAVHGSTGFAGPEGPLPELKGDAEVLAQQAMPFYENMANDRILPITAASS